MHTDHQDKGFLPRNVCFKNYLCQIYGTGINDFHSVLLLKCQLLKITLKLPIFLKSLHMYVYVLVRSFFQIVNRNTWTQS